MENATVLKYAEMFAALGHEARLEILRLLLSAHPEGMVVGELQKELEIPNSTLSHHLEVMHHQGLIRQKREGKYLRYTAAGDQLKELLGFLFLECCSRSQAVSLSELGLSSGPGFCCG